MKPVLDYGDLQPGAEASELIRSTARHLGLTPDNGVRVRLTGSVPMADEEFGTVAEGALLNACLTIGAVLLILVAGVCVRGASSSPFSSGFSRDSP